MQIALLSWDSRTYLTGYTIEGEVFLATGATIFDGAHIGTRAEVRINGVVHLKTNLPPFDMSRAD
jgi:carbonic anhydrase/acetyltransferase-like protein (isoleucine patch superfamily)